MFFTQIDSATKNQLIKRYLFYLLLPRIYGFSPYSDDLNWTNNDSRVSREHNDEGLRAVALESTDVDGWDDYDTVFIGYPIWWGIAAWPMSSFVAVNDFTGKTVIPFCTSTSSGIGQSGELLAELADAGTWLDGQRFSRGSSESDIASWVNGLNL